jgi:hypothetical protein
MVDPWRGPAQNAGISFMGWMKWTVTYTFSGLHRPGAARLSKELTIQEEPQ